MSRTKAELAAAVLRDLGIVDALSSPSAADSAFVIQKYEDAYAYYEDLGLTYWTDTDDIPSAVFAMLVDLIANRCMNAFGVAQSFDEMMNREETLLKRLRRHCARGRTGKAIRATYY